MQLIASLAFTIEASDDNVVAVSGNFADEESQQQQLQQDANSRQHEATNVGALDGSTEAMEVHALSPTSSILKTSAKVSQSEGTAATQAEAGSSDGSETGVSPPSSCALQKSAKPDQPRDTTIPSLRKEFKNRRSVSFRISDRAKRFHKSFVEATDEACKSLFGENYSVNEARFVFAACALISFNAGMINGCTVSGFLTPTHKGVSVAGYTAKYTRSALAVADGDWDTFGYNSFLILSYALGSFTSGLITPKARPYRVEPSYGPTFMIGACFLLGAAILAAAEAEPRYIYFLAAASSGVVNGIASIYSCNLIRPSMTGSTTDIALVLAQLLRGNGECKKWKAWVLATTIVGFWSGGLIAFWLARRFLTYTLFFNMGITMIVGVGLVVFLVRELDVSVEAAIFGNWRWQSTLSKLHKSGGGIASSVTKDSRQPTRSVMLDMFDDIDEDGSGTIDADELLEAILKCDHSIRAKQIRILMCAADQNGDGLIDREEWGHLADKMGLHNDSCQGMCS